MDTLDKQLAESNGQRKLIVSDGVFSMDGDKALLPELITTSESNNAILMLDDAHGFGVLGKEGGGLAAHWQEQGVHIDEDNLQVLIGTFGKAFGASGAFVAGSQELIETLIQFCRPYIYTTAISPAMAEALRTSLKLIRKDNWRRQYLTQLIQRFKDHCADLGLEVLASETPVQAVILGDAQTALQASEELLRRGVYVTAIRPPTVPKGSARLRITFSAIHTESQFQKLLDSLAEVARMNSMASLT